MASNKMATERSAEMKHYEIKYWMRNMSMYRSKPLTVIAKKLDEKNAILNRCRRKGYAVESVREFVPVPVEERFYA